LRYATIRTAALLAVTMLACLDISPAVAAVETTMLPAAPGIELATDVYRPAKEPAPVILIRTPYGRQGYDFIGEAFVTRGYAVAIQDVRGKYDSGGEHEPFRHERSDGLATLKWIAGQSWCNGRIGMWGQSYSGYSSLVLADIEMKELASILSFSGWLEAEDVVQPGGAMHLMLDLPWMLTQQGTRQRGLGEFDIDALFRHLPLSEAMRAAGIQNSTWEDPDFLETIGDRRPLGEVTRPVLHATGWNDMVYRASLKAYEQLSARAKGPQKLVVGPWYHDQMMIGEWEVGDAHFGEASGFGVDELLALSLRWFDATLKGKKNGVLQEPAVTYFLMDQNAWHTGPAWPPGEDVVEMQRWYLDSGGQANGAAGDGFLSTSKPSTDTADRFVFDPENPVPTLGGANFHFFPELIGVRDQREIETREDVLVYTSPPLAESLQITGRLQAKLHVATSGRDTDFTAKLVVLRPDGYARIVEEGIARASALLDPVPAPGQTFSLTVDMGHTAIDVPAGHRLRLEVSSSNFPKYDRNPNTGVHPFTARKLEKANQTVFHAPERASFVVLPVRRKVLTASAKGRKPLVQPIVAAPSTVAKVAGDDAAALLARGREELDAGEVDQAIATLERVVEPRPDGSAEHFWLGRAYLARLQNASMFKKLGLSKKVRASYLKAIELDPENLDARSSLASFYFNAPGIAGGSTDKGMEQVEEIRKREPKTAHVLLAGRYAGNDETAKAKEEYRAAIALDPGDPRLHYNLGFLCQQAKEWDEAFEAFEAGVKVDGDPASLYQVGRTAVLSGKRLDRGKEAMEEYIEKKPDGPGMPTEAHARWRLGMIYALQGNKDLARREYETSLTLDPELEQPREALETLD
jgi:putative CocE/NonD family hydrolase